MLKYFCSGDIHSFYSVWMLALQSKGFDINNPDHVVIICGDLFDRGDESVSCIKFVEKLLTEGRMIYVRGNHEDLLFDCIKDLTRASDISVHHISNGTLKTLADLMGCSVYDLLCQCYDRDIFESTVKNVTNLISNNTVDYFEMGDKIFVHGWVPTTDNENNYEMVHENWREGDWAHARWECGFDAWKRNLIPKGKTIVCGHWHTSYGWSKFRGRSEWGPDAEFTPFIDEGIVAVDACTAYTNMVNVVTFDEGGNLIE